MKKLLRKLLGRTSKPRMLAVGSAAPDFEVRAHDGEVVRLSDLRGRKVLLWFYPKADTPGCTLEGQGLGRDHEKLVERGVVVLGASFDGERDNRAFADKFGFPFRLLCDTDRELGLAYGACTSADAGHAHRISYVIGEDGTILHALPEVEPASHAGDILALLD